MSLDISSYTKTSVVEPHLYDDSACYEAGHCRAYINPDFPERAQGIDERCRVSPEPKFHFRAGSYSGYNGWRDKLAQFAGYGSARAAWDRQVSGPFSELINFSDCEGAIGPIVSAKLAKDFRDNLGRAEVYQPEDPWWLQKYRDWMKAFEMAADGGFVELH